MSQLSSRLLKDHLEAAEETVPLALQLMILQPHSFNPPPYTTSSPSAGACCMLLHTIQHHLLAVHVLQSAPGHLP